MLHEPIAGLGAPWLPVRVSAQQEATSPVDDVVVTAHAVRAVVRFFVASRRNPRLGVSSEETVKLFADYLRLLRQDGGAFADGSALLGLTVAGPHTAAAELDRLAAVAVNMADATAFRGAIAERSNAYRTRLRHVDNLVNAAAARLGWPQEMVQERDWSWTLLRVLQVYEARLERGGPDHAAVVGRLGVLVAPGQAAACWHRLCKVASDLAGTSGVVDEADVRGALRGHVRLAAASDMARPLEVLAARERDLESQTPRMLCGYRDGAPVNVALERAPERAAVAEAMREVGASCSTLVVHGEPSVGKSTLCLDAVLALRASGGAVTVLSLRDLPDQISIVETQFGMPLRRLFGGLEVGDARLLVVDGTEAVLERARATFLALTRAALDAGLGVVAVTRNDALNAVQQALVTLTDQTPRAVEVAPLQDQDVTRIVEAFPSVGQLRHRRSRWLLQRVGLVALLLLGGAGAELRTGALSEADVFDACWRGWVRRNEETPPGGATPDARERALLEIARAAIGVASSTAPDATALPSLRSDALLLPYGAGASWRPAEEFPNDVVRDLAASRLLLQDGLTMLAAANAPRWALRAAQIACQARLVHTGPTAIDELGEQLRVFDALAEAHGERWADVPWEAVLSSGVAGNVLLAASALLTEQRAVRLGALLRVAEHHFTNGGVGDPLRLESLVAWLAAQQRSGPGLHRNVRRAADEVMLTWLRGVAQDPLSLTDDVTRAVRRQVRDNLLDHASAERPDEAVLGGLATLKEDLNAPVRAVLRRVAVGRPFLLAPVVEDGAAVVALANTDQDLLAELTLAYYLEQPSDNPLHWRGPLDTGVRRHRHLWGFGTPRAAWYYGPFWALLQVSPAQGLTVINAILNHAVRVRPDDLTISGRPQDLLGLGPLEYAGDGQSYMWYRGTSFGPEACTSALLAAERFADAYVEAGAGLRDVGRRLLEGATNLATVGLVVGFFIRHLDSLDDELDDFFAVPELWDLERDRSVQESAGLAVGDEPGVHGSDHRSKSFRDVAAELAVRAKLAGDENRVRQLQVVGERMLAAADTAADGQPLLGARINAGYLDADLYRVEESDGLLQISYQEPPELAEELLADQRFHLDRMSEALRLGNRYRLQLTPPHGAGMPDVGPAELAADLTTARTLAEDAPADDREVQALVAVAGAVVRAVGRGGSSIDADGATWAASVVLEAADPPEHHPLEYAGSLYSFGIDRLASFAVPSLLLPGFTEEPTGDPLLADVEDIDLVVRRLACLTTSAVDEVRRFVALALRPLWAEPCTDVGGICRHCRAWVAVEAGACHVAMAAWNGERREFVQLEGDLPAALAAASAKDLVLPRLAAALASSTDASVSAPCLADRAPRLRDALLEAYARTVIEYNREGYENRREGHVMVADALLGATVAVPDLLQRTIGEMGGISGSAQDLLDAVCTVATYEPTRRQQMRATWPAILSNVLDQPERPFQDEMSGRDFDGAIAALLPCPRPVTFDEDMDATVQAAHDGWPRAAEMAELIDRWLVLAAGQRSPVDHLIGLLRATSLEDQIHLGLPWVRRLVVPHGHEPVLGSFMIMSWLESLPSSGQVVGARRTDFDVILDALAAGGVSRARPLQHREE